MSFKFVLDVAMRTKISVCLHKIVYDVACVGDSIGSFIVISWELDSRLPTDPTSGLSWETGVDSSGSPNSPTRLHYFES